MDCNSKATSLPQAAAFLSFSSPLTTTKNPVGEQCKPVLSRSWASLLATSSYSKPFVQPCGPTKAARKQCDHGVVEMNTASISRARCSRSWSTGSFCGVSYGKCQQSCVK